MKLFLKKIAAKIDSMSRLQDIGIGMCLLGCGVLLYLCFFGQATLFRNFLFYGGLIIMGISLVLGVLYDITCYRKERNTNKRVLFRNLIFFTIFLVIIVWGTFLIEI